ncbi:MAG: hypothetical protein JJU02_10975 [Cryomorphaceae bacterium]|nr:hypothetical protein [Cryomorphaceae bacterium]
MKNLHPLLFSLLTFFFVANLNAQSTKYNGGSGHFSIGYSHGNYDNLNQFFSDFFYEIQRKTSKTPPPYNIDVFQSPTLVIGGGGFGVINNFIFGGGISGK